jgi:hypothetical protein
VKQGLFWIASYPRSGNTWTRAFLGALEDSMAGRPPSAARLAGVSERSLDGGGFSSANLRKRLSLQVAYARQRPGVLLIKTHSARVMVGPLPTIAPDVTAGAVYLVRDPRDVAVSFASMFKQDLDAVVRGLAHSGWVSAASGLGGFEVVGSWSENVGSWCEQADTQVIRYEDLLASPAKPFGELVRRIGWQPSLLQLTAAVAAASFDRLQAASRTDPRALEDIQIAHGVAGRWRSVLTAAQAKTIEQDHRDLMLHFGYL